MSPMPEDGRAEVSNSDDTFRHLSIRTNGTNQFRYYWPTPTLTIRIHLHIGTRGLLHSLGQLIPYEGSYDAIRYASIIVALWTLWYTDNDSS